MVGIRLEPAEGVRFSPPVMPGKIRATFPTPHSNGGGGLRPIGSIRLSGPDSRWAATPDGRHMKLLPTCNQL
jgi:hypothetical protein